MHVHRNKCSLQNIKKIVSIMVQKFEDTDNYKEQRHVKSSQSVKVIVDCYVSLQVSWHMNVDIMITKHAHLVHLGGCRAPRHRNLLHMIKLFEKT